MIGTSWTSHAPTTLRQAADLLPGGPEGLHFAHWGKMLQEHWENALSQHCLETVGQDAPCGAWQEAQDGTNRPMRTDRGGLVSSSRLHLHLLAHVNSSPGTEGFGWLTEGCLLQSNQQIPVLSTSCVMLPVGDSSSATGRTSDIRSSTSQIANASESTPSILVSCVLLANS